MDFSLGKLPGPRTCRLVVVRDDGSTEVVSTWSVPDGGYGTNANTQLLTLSAATSTKRDDIKQFEVQEIDSRGATDTLVTVPAA